MITPTDLDLVHEKEKLIEDFLSVRVSTELICAPLSPEDALLSVTEETSPPKWHLAHTTWFYEKFILETYDSSHESDPEYHYLFNSYYKSVGPHIPKNKRATISRPSLSEVKTYREETTRKVVEVMKNLTGKKFFEAKKILVLGMNHEQQHQELLLMDIKRNFFENPLRPRYEAHHLTSVDHISSPSWQNVPSGLYEIGAANKKSEFHYDNEGDSHKHWIDSFMLSSHLVTNGDYLAFMKAGGYENPMLWLSDGWDLKNKEGWEHPLYWELKDGAWWIMTLAGMVPLDVSAPVAHISYYEAQAYADWKGCRLPTEFEWEVASRLEHIKGHFLENGPHDAAPAHDEYESFSQIHGTLWEWTQSAYLPYPRFESFHDGLSEYNSKFMCNQFVLRGGSCITPESHYRTTYRNFYYPHMRWQYCGLRLAKDLA